MAGSSVVVVGGGLGGVVTARELLRRLDDDHRVTLVERHAVLRFAPSLLWVMSGARRPEQICRDLSRLERRGIERVQSAVDAIDTDAGVVKTSDSAIDYDYLVVALGASLAPKSLPGFSEGAHNIYTAKGAQAAGADLRKINGGRVAVLVSSMPYKCPAAPYEAAFLADTILRRRGVRDRAAVDVYTPEVLPMPTAGPEVGGQLRSLLESRGIGFHPERTAQSVDAAARQIVLDDGERADYDILLGVPPHRPPSVVRESTLADGGYVPVDPATLATGVRNVYAVGDVAAVPIAGGKMLPKAGVFAEREAQVVARRIADELKGREPSAVFDGHGACFLEVGDGRAALGKGDFYAPDGAQVTLHPPSRRWHLAKVALERYWFLRWA